MYEFPDDEADTACDVITRHVEEGQLHPYAGLILLQMVGDTNES